MMEKEKGNAKLQKRGVGFVACYKGDEIAFAKNFDALVSNPIVKNRLGQEDLVIKHDIPEGMLAAY